MHYTIHDLPEKFFEPQNLPKADPSGLSVDDAHRFERVVIAILTYIDTRSPTAASAESGISASEVIRHFYRFAEYDDEGEIKGWTAILKPYTRNKPYTLQPDNPRTSAQGQFTNLLLRKPEIEEGLIEAIQSKFGRGGVKLSRKQRAEVYEKFKALCAHIPSTEYPWKYHSAAKKSVYTYIDVHLDLHPEDFPLWFGPNAKGRMQVGRSKSGFRLARQPFDLVQIDAHKFDVVGTIRIDTEHGPCVIPIERIWIVLLLDAFSGACLGYQVSFEKQVSGETVEAAVISSQTPWRPRKLCEKLEYEPGSALPAGFVEGLDRCPIVALQMDNFSSHYSKVLQHRVRKALGCHVCYGAVGAWWTNPNIERFFRVLEERGIQRVSSSMGNGPQDPMRPKDPLGTAIKDAVGWQYIVDLAEVLITARNKERSGARSDMSPLEIIHNHIQADDIGLLTDLPLPTHPSAPRLGWEHQRKRVGGSRSEKSLRRPYIELYGRHYTSDILEDRFDLIDTYVNVHIRIIDMTIEAYEGNGTFLGELTINGGPKGNPVGLLELRRARQGRNREEHPEDAIARYREQLMKVASNDAAERPRHVSAAATQIAQLDLDAREREARLATEAVGGGDAPAKPSKPANTPKAAPIPFVATQKFGRLRSM